MENQKQLLSVNVKDTKFVNLIKRYGYDFNLNDIVAGTIYTQEYYGRLMSLGSPQAVYLPTQEVATNNSGHLISLTINETYEFLITKKLNTSIIIVSMKRLSQIRAWDRIKTMYEEDAVRLAKIVSYNKGGAIVFVESLKGFVPKSHLVEHVQADGLIPFKFLEVDKANNLLTLSNRCAILGKNFENFSVGNNFTGQVEDIKPYGIFIKVHNIKGLLHRSEITKKYRSLNDLSTMFTKGQELQVKLIHIDMKKGRVSFALE
uniref:ribosomal protein S1 n=1 Tax=Timspurckia oligopyrenoides TaxID=708627 RepID=UPI001FCD8B4C|nr:ribosomal protein S1 [Timspurckia oligopyrenoides]UNJ17592.1 ribosomal protein S1 [Timspurckia oligopyrenoides]